MSLFDTVRLAIERIHLDTDELSPRGWEGNLRDHSNQGMPKESSQFVLRRKKSPVPYACYFLPSGTLVAECSLPRLIYNNNIQLLGPDDVKGALDKVTKAVSDLVGAAVPDADTWIVRRADAVFQWNVGNRVPDYLHAFRHIELPRHYRIAIDREATLYWRNRSRTIRLYDKWKESRDDRAKGLLRLEVQLKHVKREILGVGEANSMKAVDVLNWSVARALLAKRLEGLGTDLVISNDEEFIKTTIKTLGGATARRLLGTRFALQHFSADELVEFGVERTLLWRDKRAINGLGLAVSDAGCGVLPPLTLPEEYTGEPGRVR